MQSHPVRKLLDTAPLLHMPKYINKIMFISDTVQQYMAYAENSPFCKIRSFKLDNKALVANAVP